MIVKVLKWCRKNETDHQRWRYITIDHLTIGVHIEKFEEEKVIDWINQMRRRVVCVCICITPFQS